MANESSRQRRTEVLAKRNREKYACQTANLALDKTILVIYQK